MVKLVVSKLFVFVWYRLNMALLAAERQSFLLAQLQHAGSLQVTEMAAKLGVTEVTVRRDIAQLAAANQLQRVHGGAVSLPDAVTPNGLGSMNSDTPIGVVVPSLNPYWLEVTQSMRAAAAAAGYRTVLRTTSYQAADERPVLDRLVTHDAVAGLILVPRTDSPGISGIEHWMAASNLPIVLMERDARHPVTYDTFESVKSDHAIGALLAARHLADLGHRKVGVLMASRSPSAHRIAVGWRAACAELGLGTDRYFERVIANSATSLPSVFAEEIDEALDIVTKTGTTGLLVHSDPEAFALMQRAAERGIEVPNELSIIAYDDMLADLDSVALTAVRPDRKALAYTAIAALQRRMKDPSSTVHRTSINPRLVVRASTAPPPGKLGG